MVNTMTNERAGCAIGIITRGNVSIKWAQHLEEMKRYFPIGMFWKVIVVEGKGWAEGRNEVVRIAQKEKVKSIFWIDDDVFVPIDALSTLLNTKKDIISGVYWTKTENSAPVIFKTLGGGPMVDFPVDEVFEIAGSGMGCTITDMSVFDAFDKVGLPYFQENWIMELDDGRLMKCPVGEDHYFFYHAKKLGFPVWAHGGVLCGHYDSINKVMYPSKEVVRGICSKKLTEMGRTDVINDYNKAYGMDPSKKTVVFVNWTSNKFNGDELEKRGLGGAETCIINLARELYKFGGLNVHIFNNCDEPGIYDGVIYHNLMKERDEIKKLSPDLLVLVRNTNILGNGDFKNNFNAKKTVLWLHDLPGDPSYEGLEHFYKDYDAIVALTEFHKNAVKSFYPFLDESKMLVLGNGVDEKLFNKNVAKVPGRLIYSSTPFRGLDVLAEVFPEIKRRVPHANLRVFSSMKLYGSSYNDDEFAKLYSALRHMSGVEYFGSVKQDRLAQEMQEAEVLTYPNVFPETYCITAIEALTAGTPIVTSKYAALKEVVPNGAGFVLAKSPYRDEYKQEFIETVVKLLTDKTLWASMSEAAKKVDYSWRRRAKEWNARFFAAQGVDSIIQVGNINTPEYWDNVYKEEIKRGDDRPNIELEKFVAEHMNDGDKLLDIGCGTGRLTRLLQEKYPNSEIWGSDFSLVAIDYCRQQSKKVFYANHPLLNGDFEKGYFDVITALHVLEHLDKPEEILFRAKDLLKKDGKLIIALPLNDDSWYEHQKIWQLKDVKSLLELVPCTYKIDVVFIKRDDGSIVKYEDARNKPFKQVIVTITFEA